MKSITLSGTEYRIRDTQATNGCVHCSARHDYRLCNRLTYTDPACAARSGLYWKPHYTPKAGEKVA